MKRKFKSVMGAVLALVMVLSLVFILDMSLISAQAADGFYVNGTTLYDANGNPFVMRGINVAHAWYKDKTVESLKGVADTGANTARIVFSNGQQWAKDELPDVIRVIDECKNNNLVAVVEVHDATGYDDYDSLDRAVDYWIENKAALIGNEKYVILNIANEWCGSWESQIWHDGYVRAIKKLRDAGIKNTIMVDCAGWGQYPKSIADYGTEVLNADVLRNTMFSIHMYEYAGGDAATVKYNIDSVLNKGLAVVIGEFGGEHTNGDVDEHTIMSYCQEKRVGYIGWSWTGNGSAYAYLDISYTFSGGNYSPWGQTLIYDTNGIKNTSRICSVFGGSVIDPDPEPEDSYIQYFYGSNTSPAWEQAVSVMTTKNGGELRTSDIKSNGYFYTEYDGAYGEVEFILQSWSGYPEWIQVAPSESGTTNGVDYAKFYYHDLDSAGMNLDILDQVHVSAKNSTITVYKLQYVYY